MGSALHVEGLIPSFVMIEVYWYLYSFRTVFQDIENFV